MNKCLANKLNVVENRKPNGRPKNILGDLSHPHSLDTSNILNSHNIM